jgi:hypothetical protein
MVGYHVRTRWPKISLLGLIISHAGDSHCKQLYFGRLGFVRVLFRTIWQFPMAISYVYAHPQILYLLMGWLVALAVQLIPVTVLFIGSFFLPFSPRWLLSVGRDNEAWEVVKRLHDDPSDPDFAITEFAEMKAQIELERKTGSFSPWGKARMAFSRASYRKRLGLGFLLQMGNQSVGLYYSNYQ